jgi:predicted membrane-bound spermidine synthase
MDNNHSILLWNSYVVVALVGIGVTIFVMQLTERDRVNKLDAPVVCWLRRGAFTGINVALCYSLWCDEWKPTLPVLGLVSSGVFVLIVNAIALAMRNTPRTPRVEQIDVRFSPAQRTYKRR